MHALFGTIGATLLAKQRVFVPSQLHLQEIVAVAAFSVLYSINIVVSNVSLQLVTVPVNIFLCALTHSLICGIFQFHQIVRAATPIFTILLSALFFGAESSRAKKISLIPVVAGVGLA
jgi:drug/metabolite transporter (DMT)-like permease